MPTPDPVVRCADVTLRFDRRVVLDRFSMDVHRGEVFGLVGANGGSKTTILRTVAGLLVPGGGTCRVFGQSPHAVRRRIGFMAQGLALYEHLTVAENLLVRASLYGVRHPRAVVAAALDRFALRPHAATRVAVLSGGWARRAQFAAALLHGPDLLLLDEPTAGLDAVARQELWRHVLAMAASGTTILVSTHDLAEAERFSRLLFLVDGKVQASGRVGEVVAQSGARSFLLRGQGAAEAAGLVATGLVAAYPSFGDLRIVTRSAETAAGLAARLGVAAQPVPASLDDAVMTLLCRHAA